MYYMAASGDWWLELHVIPAFNKFFASFVGLEEGRAIWELQLITFSIVLDTRERALSREFI